MYYPFSNPSPPRHSNLKCGHRKIDIWGSRSKATIACHSAVKLGDKLSYEEMKVLIEEWLTRRYPATCPHGRSICYRLEHKDIARKLDRH